MSLLRYGRMVLSVIALLAMLVSGGSGVRLETSGHACDGTTMGVTMDDCRDHHKGDGAARPDCAAFICAASLTALPAHDASHHAFAVATFSSQAAPRDDAWLRDLRGPPDLRPPIA